MNLGKIVDHELLRGVNFGFYNVRGIYELFSSEKVMYTAKARKNYLMGG